jgi:NTP pyrophosphatase (non-canonical NTP hydrolase)
MSITWNEYQQQALTTAIYPLSRELDYTILGLCSEVGELGIAYSEIKTVFGESQLLIGDLHSEIGDCFWYVAAIADALKVPLDYIAHIQTEAIMATRSRGLAILEVVAEASSMAGILKKAIRDNDGYISVAADTKIKLSLCRTLWLLDWICEQWGTTRQAVMVKNLAKLADRKNRGVLQGSGDHR